MFVDSRGDFLENGTRVCTVIQCFVQGVREQLFPDFDILSRESPWFVSGPIVLERQQVPVCSCRGDLRDRKQKDGDDFVPIFGGIHPFLGVVPPRNTPHVRNPSLRLLQVVLEDLGGSHERDDRCNLAPHQQLSREPPPLLEGVFIAGWTARETGDKDGVMFLKVAQHWDTDALQEFEWEDVTCDAPEMPH